MSKKMSSESLVILLRNLASAARHRLPFADLLSVLKEDPELSSKRITCVVTMHDALIKGRSLADAMAAVPQQFPDGTVTLVRQAEQNGQLAEVLDLLADDEAWRAQTRQTVRSALAWPATMFSVAMMIMFVMLIFVLPAYQELFYNFGSELPLPTRMLMSTSAVLLSYFWFWLVLGAAVVVAVRRKLIPAPVMALAQRLILLVPFVRNYLGRHFNFLLLRWMPICVRTPEMQPAVLAHIKTATRFMVYGKALDTLSGRLASGQMMGKALDHLPHLPRRIALQLQIGEKVGDVDAAIAQVTETSITELEGAQSRFGRGIFLFAYLFIGGIIAFSVITLYLPIFQMGSVV